MKMKNTKSFTIRLLCSLLFLFLQFKVSAQTAPINLLCKMDNGVDLRLTIDLDNKLMWNTWLLELIPSQEKWKIVKISDSEINAEYKPFAESKVDGAEKNYFSWNIERYTLKISEYGPLGFGRTSNWRYGKCEILKKQL
jgi:hypothetical protein